MCEIGHADIKVIQNFRDRGDIEKTCSFVALFYKKHTRDKIMWLVDLDLFNRMYTR